MKSFSCSFAIVVTPLVQNSNSFLEDLRRLNQLKDISLSKSVDVTTHPHISRNESKKLKR